MTDVSRVMMFTVKAKVIIHSLKDSSAIYITGEIHLAEVEWLQFFIEKNTIDLGRVDL